MIGLDIAKSVFQVHCVDAGGNLVLRRQLKRRCVLAFFNKLPPCMVGIEACASAHHWSRELQAVELTVKFPNPNLSVAARPQCKPAILRAIAIGRRCNFCSPTADVCLGPDEFRTCSARRAHRRVAH
jgi:transposase